MMNRFFLYLTMIGIVGAIEQNESSFTDELMQSLPEAILVETSIPEAIPVETSILDSIERTPGVQSEHICFGDVSPFFNHLYGRFVFVGQYDGAKPYPSVVVRLPGEIERYIVMQSPINMSDQNFILRVHPVIHSDSFAGDQGKHVMITLKEHNGIRFSNGIVDVITHPHQQLHGAMSFS